MIHIKKRQLRYKCQIVCDKYAVSFIVIVLELACKKQNNNFIVKNTTLTYLWTAINN